MYIFVELSVISNIQLNPKESWFDSRFLTFTLIYDTLWCQVTKNIECLMMFYPDSKKVQVHVNKIIGDVTENWK